MYSRAALSPTKKARKRKERLIILSFLAPNLIGFLMFTVFPVFAAMFLSFSEWNIISDIKWVGFDNYSKLFTSKRFWQAVYHTLEYTVVSVPIGLLLATFFAVLMNRKIRGVTFFRTVYYLPVVSSTVAVAMLWKFIYADNVGLLASIFRFLGLEAPKWISSTKWALRSIMIMSTWQGLGYNIVIILAGLQGISSVYYEAARIDGIDEFEVLMDHSDAQVGCDFRRRYNDWLAVDINLAFIREIDSREHIHQRCFAAPVLPENRQDFSLFERHADVVIRKYLLAEALGNIF